MLHCCAKKFTFCSGTGKFVAVEFYVKKSSLFRYHIVMDVLLRFSGNRKVNFCFSPSSFALHLFAIKIYFVHRTLVRVRAFSNFIIEFSVYNFFICQKLKKNCKRKLKVLKLQMLMYIFI